MIDKKTYEQTDTVIMNKQRKKGRKKHTTRQTDRQTETQTGRLFGGNLDQNNKALTNTFDNVESNFRQSTTP